MKLKTSFINWGILYNDFKSLGWIGAIYLLSLLLSFPLKIIMIYSKAGIAGLLSKDPEIYRRIFLFNGSWELLPLIVAPVLAALLLFGYLQNSKAADMTHALPVKRDTFYHTHILAGLIFLFVPLVITALVSWALVAGLGIPKVSSPDIFTWLAISLLFNLLYFMTGVATGMFTGLLSVQGILTYILLLLPAGFSILLLHNMKLFTYGFALDYYTQFVNISPLVEIFRCQIHNIEIVAYLLAVIALYLLGWYLYRSRQLETAGNAITFGALRPFFKYGVTFCFMLLLGSYFYETQNSIGWAYFGYFLGSLPAYFGVEILLHKSLHVFKPKIIKGYGIFALIVIICIFALRLDFTGYERRLPELAEIESVYMDNVCYPLSYLNGRGASSIAYSNVAGVMREMPLPVYAGADNIASIHALHKKIIDNRTAEKAAPPDKNSIIAGAKRSFYIVYNPKNGSHVYRQYNLNPADYARQLKPIYESREYKTFHNAILSVNPSEIKMMEINAMIIDAIGVEKVVRVIDRKLIDDAFTALQNDIMEETCEEMTAKQPGWARISIIFENNKAMGLEWKKSYANFEQWLKSTGQYNNARLTAREDIQYAVVTKQAGAGNEEIDKYKEAAMYGALPRQYLINAESIPGHLKISDPEMLEACLRQYTLRQYTYPDPQPYSVFFLLKNGKAFAGGFTEADAPAFIKEHFARQSLTAFKS